MKSRQKTGGWINAGEDMACEGCGEIIHRYQLCFEKQDFFYCLDCGMKMAEDIYRKANPKRYGYEYLDREYMLDYEPRKAKNNLRRKQ